MATREPGKRASKPVAKRAAKKAVAPPPVKRAALTSRIVGTTLDVVTQARSIQRTARQSPYKMRLVIDQIRGMRVNDALALLKFSKKGAAKQIEKTLNSAVANCERAARAADTSVDVDTLIVAKAIINEGPKLKRWMPAAMGRATPIQKRTSHVEIVVAEAGR